MKILALCMIVMLGIAAGKLIGDFDHDCDVDWFDFGIFASRYGYDRGRGYRGWADLNKDGSIDRYDFGIFAQNYWTACNPVI